MSTTSQKVKALAGAIDRHTKAKQDLNDAKARLRETEEHFVELGRVIMEEENKRLWGVSSSPEFDRKIREEATCAMAEAKAHERNCPESVPV